MGSLTGLKMLDLSRLLPGAYCSLLLADLGMEVLKVEDLEQGDYMRKLGSIRKKESVQFLALNRNKKSMTLNLKAEEGREVFYRLIKTYDIVLESFRPGVVDHLGIGYEELKKRNPRVIFCSLSGYGQDGPYRERSGHDINYISLGGILELTGRRNEPPTVPVVQIADIGGGGMMAAFALLAAIIHREKIGEGQFLDVSMLDGVISWISAQAVKYFMDSELPKRGETLLSGRYACYQVYSTKDRKNISLGALERKFWKNFCEAVGRPDLVEKQFVEGEGQIRLIEEVGKIFETRTQKEWADFLKNADTCCEPVLTLEEVFHHPQVLHRQMMQEVEHPVEGKTQQIRSPVKSSRFPFEIRSAAPLWGEHTHDVLREIGYSDGSIKHLRELKVI